MSGDVEPLTRMEKLILRLIALHESNYSYARRGEKFDKIMDDYLNGR